MRHSLRGMGPRWPGQTGSHMAIRGLHTMISNRKPRKTPPNKLWHLNMVECQSNMKRFRIVNTMQIAQKTRIHKCTSTIPILPKYFICIKKDKGNLPKYDSDSLWIVIL